MPNAPYMEFVTGRRCAQVGDSRCMPTCRIHGSNRERLERLIRYYELYDRKLISRSSLQVKMDLDPDIESANRETEKRSVDLLDLVDDRSRRYHIELIFPDQEPDLASDWTHWRRYKMRNRDRFSLIDADLMSEHQQIAEEWE